MKRRSQFSLLVVRGDGTRIVRFNFARPLAIGAVAVVTLGFVSVAFVVGDWVSLRRLTRDMVGFAQKIAQQDAALTAVNARMADLQREVGSWRDVHARIQGAFGPDANRNARDQGIGGGSIPAARLPARLSPVDEVDRLAETIAEEGERLRSLDRLIARVGKALAALPSRWPVRGSVNSEFGLRQSPWSKRSEFHNGIDIRATHGTPIQAPAAGTVVFAGRQPEYGNSVVLDHGREIRSMYAHLSEVRVKPGEHISRGTVIGLTGNTGRSSGPHLHYEILVRGQAVNPRSYLWD